MVLEKSLKVAHCIKGKKSGGPPINCISVRRRIHPFGAQPRGFLAQEPPDRCVARKLSDDALGTKPKRPKDDVFEEFPALFLGFSFGHLEAPVFAFQIEVAPDQVPILAPASFEAGPF